MDLNLILLVFAWIFGIASFVALVLGIVATVKYCSKKETDALGMKFLLMGVFALVALLCLLILDGRTDDNPQETTTNVVTPAEPPAEPEETEKDEPEVEVPEPQEVLAGSWEHIEQGSFGSLWTFHANGQVDFSSSICQSEGSVYDGFITGYEETNGGIVLYVRMTGGTYETTTEDWPILVTFDNYENPSSITIANTYWTGDPFTFTRSDTGRLDSREFCPTPQAPHQLTQEEAFDLLATRLDYPNSANGWEMEFHRMDAYGYVFYLHYGYYLVTFDGGLYALQMELVSDEYAGEMGSAYSMDEDGARQLLNVYLETSENYPLVDSIRDGWMFQIDDTLPLIATSGRLYTMFWSPLD